MMTYADRTNAPAQPKTSVLRSIPAEAYMVFAMSAACITFGAYKRGQLDDVLNTGKAIMAKIENRIHHSEKPLTPCE